jgi:hypothetical protein
MQWGNGAIKTDKATRLNRVASYLAMSTMLNGPQMLWMFEEIGYDFSINSNEKEKVKTKAIVHRQSHNLRH